MGKTRQERMDCTRVGLGMGERGGYQKMSGGQMYRLQGAGWLRD